MKYIALIIFILAMVLAINWMKNDIERIKQQNIMYQLNTNYNMSLLEVWTMQDDLSKLLNVIGKEDSIYNSYNSRKVDDKYTFDGLTVSTVFTEDMGYETAIIDSNEVTVVERYPDKKSSAKGHFKWIEWINNKDNNEVQDVGYGNLIDSFTVKLKRR